MPAMRMIQLNVNGNIPMTLNPHAIAYFTPQSNDTQTMVLLDGMSFTIANDAFKAMSYLWGVKNDG